MCIVSCVYIVPFSVGTVFFNSRQSSESLIGCVETCLTLEHSTFHTTIHVVFASKY